MAQYTFLQVVTYHWSEADKSMICPSTEKKYYQHYDAATTTSVRAGTLFQLPLEVIHNILGYLDICAIGAVRCLSRESRSIVDFFPPYRDLVTHAPSVLRAIHSTKVASIYTVGRVYDVLTDDRCVCCGAFGPYLSLITCERCCFSCLYDPAMAPTTLTSAAAALNLSKREMEKNFSVVTTLPGTYTIERTERKRISKVVSVWKVLAFAIEKLSRTQQKAVNITDLNEETKALSIMRHYNDPIRFMVSTPIPYLNARKRRTESGLWCRGCELVWYRSSGRQKSMDYNKRMCNMAYSEEEYLLHFETCQAAKEIWELYEREGKGLEHLYRGRHREWDSRVGGERLAD